MGSEYNLNYLQKKFPIHYFFNIVEEYIRYFYKNIEYYREIDSIKLKIKNINLQIFESKIVFVIKNKSYIVNNEDEITITKGVFKDKVFIKDERIENLEKKDIIFIKMILFFISYKSHVL